MNIQLDKSPSRIRGLFDRIAPKYDFINHSLSLGIDHYWRRQTAKAVFTELPVQIAGDPLLDVCCGTGDLSIAMMREMRRRGLAPKITGVDFSTAMLEIGKKKIQKLKAQNEITLQEGDALQLPFDADAFSVVCVGFGLRNVADTDGGISEMVRVCKPGGIIAILDFDLPKVPIISNLYRFYLQRVLPMYGNWFSKNREGAYDYFSESVVQFDKGTVLAERLENAGLINVHFKSMTLATVSLYLGHKPGYTPLRQ